MEMDADALKNEVQKQVVEGRQMVWKYLLQDDGGFWRGFSMTVSGSKKTYQ